MANTLKLEIVTPEGTVYSEDVEMVTLPGVVGQMGIYPQHVPLMTQMVPGVALREDGCAAVAADRIDEAKAEEARQRAEARLREKLSDEEVASVNASLARSLAQLRVKRRQRR